MVDVELGHPLQPQTQEWIHGNVRSFFQEPSLSLWALHVVRVRTGSGPSLKRSHKVGSLGKALRVPFTGTKSQAQPENLPHAIPQHQTRRKASTVPLATAQPRLDPIVRQRREMHHSKEHFCTAPEPTGKHVPGLDAAAQR